MLTFEEFINSPHMKKLEEITAFKYSAAYDLSRTFELLDFTIAGKYVLIGGIARGQHSSARATGDVDILVSDDDFNTVVKAFTGIEGIKRKRPHTWQIGVWEVEVVTPSYINLSSEIFNFVIETKQPFKSSYIASPEALILLKMQRLSQTDKKDIEDTIKSNKEMLNLEPVYNLLGEWPRRWLKMLFDRTL